MADRGFLSPGAVITFELAGVGGISLTWPQDSLGDVDAVSPKCWCQDDGIMAERRVTTDELKAQKRELALQLALEIYTKFGWMELPVQRLEDEQKRTFGAG